MAEPFISRAIAMSDTRAHLSAALKRLEAMSAEVGGFIQGLERDDILADETIDAETRDATTEALAALDGGLTECEAVVKQLYRIVWTEL